MCWICVTEDKRYDLTNTKKAAILEPQEALCLNLLSSMQLWEPQVALHTDRGIFRKTVHVCVDVFDTFQCLSQMRTDAPLRAPD